jgi:hypothetical protein
VGEARWVPVTELADDPALTVTQKIDGLALVITELGRAMNLAVLYGPQWPHRYNASPASLCRVNDDGIMCLPVPCGPQGEGER